MRRWRRGRTLKRFDQISIANPLGVVDQIFNHPGAEAIGSDRVNRVAQRLTHALLSPARQTSQSLDTSVVVRVSDAIPQGRPYFWTVRDTARQAETRPVTNDGRPVSRQLDESRRHPSIRSLFARIPGAPLQLGGQGTSDLLRFMRGERYQQRNRRPHAQPSECRYQGGQDSGIAFDPKSCPQHRH